MSGLQILLPPPTAALLERAREFRQTAARPAPASPSATVILMRDRKGSDGGGGLEVFLQRRVPAMAFAPGVHVFPGGVVDPTDYPPDGDLPSAFVTAAVRETFEETGVLLAARAGGSTQASEPLEQVLEDERLALLAHDTTLSDVLRRHSLVIAADALRPWAHWVTPDFEPRRYDTRFFVALLPGHQATREVGGESDAVDWVTPAAALAAQERREWLLMVPTEVTLRDLAAHTSAASAFEAAATRRVRRLRPVLDLDVDPPRWVLDDVASP
ncbi:MAG: hypothetical protein QOJ62_998 [Actinomycetota bacterium]|nr:hypothetical protein [Actinomycetota bacterium]